MFSKGLAIVSVNLSAPALPKPVTGISQGSPFAPAQGGDGPATLMDMFAGLLGGNTTDPAAAPMLQATTTSQASELTLPLAALPVIATGEAFDSTQSAAPLPLGAEEAVRIRPDNLIAQIARALAGQNKGEGSSDLSAGLSKIPDSRLPEAVITLADPQTAPVETEVADDDVAGLDPSNLFAQILDMLAVLQQTIADGNPADPATSKKLDEALAVLAEIMGMPVGELKQMLAPQLAIPNPGASGAANAPASSLAGAAPALPPAATLPAATPPGALPVVDGAVDGAMPADAPVRPVVPANDLEALTERLNALARSLAPSDPALADKLRTLAGNIEAADPELLAKLGFSAELKLASKDGDAALDRFLAAKLPDQPVQPSGPKLAEASLDLPEIARPEGAVKPATTASEAKPEPAKTEAPRLEASRPEGAAQRQPAEVVKATEPVRARAEPNPAPAAPAAGVEKAADPAQSGSNAAVLPPTRTDGLVAGARAVQAAYQTPHTQVNLPQLAFEIVRHVGEGHNRFQIRLDPADLGRIDVRMEIDNKGTLNARMTVERPETLDLLQRDQRALEKALAQAGLDSAKTNLEFSLRQNPFARQDTDQGQQRGGFQFEGGKGDKGGSADEPTSTVATTLYRGAATASGVNLFV